MNKTMILILVLILSLFGCNFDVEKTGNALVFNPIPPDEVIEHEDESTTELWYDEEGEVRRRETTWPDGSKEVAGENDAWRRDSEGNFINYDEEEGGISYINYADGTRVVYEGEEVTITWPDGTETKQSKEEFEKIFDQEESGINPEANAGFPTADGGKKEFVWDEQDIDNDGEEERVRTETKYDSEGNVESEEVYPLE